MDLIKKETDFALENGADGIVIGMLKPDGSIDIPKMEQVTQQVGTIPITFHRAMDMCNDLPIALNQLIDLGIENVLTSGGYKSAFDGKEILKQLVNQSQGRINILAGGGVSASNIAILRDYANLTSFHFSCRKKQPGKMLYKNPKVNMSSNSIGLASKETNDDEFAYWVFDEDKFAAIKSALYK
jgi:copper homeostasis protein